MLYRGAGSGRPNQACTFGSFTLNLSPSSVSTYARGDLRELLVEEDLLLPDDETR